MTKDIPILPGVPDQSLSVSLGGKRVLLRLLWNEDSGAWFMDVSDADGDMIKAGARVVSNWPLLLRVSDERLPSGNIMALRMVGSGPPDITELGETVRLVYVESDDE